MAIDDTPAQPSPPAIEVEDVRGDSATRAVTNDQAACAADQGRYRAPGIADPSHPQAVPGSLLPSLRPLAAYRLGFGIRDLWMWNQMQCQYRWLEFAEKIPEVLAQLEVDRVALADGAPPDVLRELGLLIADFVGSNHDFAQRLLSETDDEILEKYERRPPNRHLWARLRELADRMVPRGNMLRSLYEFGAALGDLGIRNWEQEPRSYPSPSERNLIDRWRHAGLPDQIPDLTHLISLARDLPDELKDQVPHIRTLARLSSTAAGPGQLKSLVEVHDDLHHVSLSGSDVGAWPVSRIYFALDDRIREGIGRASIELDDKEHGCSWNRSSPAGGMDPVGIPEIIESPLPQASPIRNQPSGEIKPVWDRNDQRVMYDGKLAREVRFDGENLFLILDTFAECGWPEWVDNPMPGKEETRGQRLSSSIRQFNKISKFIKLRTRKNGKEVGWESC